TAVSAVMGPKGQALVGQPSRLSFRRRRKQSLPGPPGQRQPGRLSHHNAMRLPCPPSRSGTINRANIVAESSADEADTDILRVVRLVATVWLGGERPVNCVSARGADAA